ncbi:carbohydrate binding domain-containing protein [Methylacidiphilum caldifontis]|uniref:carbohydrate binding domain-containing protein n=1 Tax=Methylacidiphilum caldifontis TaxID=2795386 RepID=UPI001A8C4932|nr:carbohydrate binding domain-containing protein [Methylacidiphilum caldifontis]QSR88595.1 carbohydrate binding domain-containing protein [Methylacidiphilum caldifontis]
MFKNTLRLNNSVESFPVFQIFIVLYLVFLLGLSFFHIFDNPSLRPLNSSYWLKEAEKQLSEGNESRALSIVQYVAARCGPVSPTRLNIAELLIELNRPEQALVELKFVFETDDELRKTAVYLAKSILGVNGGLALIDKNKPSSLSAYLLLAIDQKWIEEAKTVWNMGTTVSKNFFDQEISKKYVNFLISANELQEAKRVWNSLMNSDAMVWNGDFEESFQNWGFGWKFHPRSSFMKIKQDEQMAFSKKNSLSIEFIGIDPNHDHVLVEQLIVLEPKKYYHLSGAVRFEDIVSSSGIVLDVYDQNNDQILGSTVPVSNSKKWRVVETTLRTPKTVGTSYLRIRWKESPEWEIPLYGKAWIDKVQLEEIVPENKESSPEDEDSGDEQQEGDDPFENDSQENPEGSSSS